MTAPSFEAGQPRRSRPIRAVARLIGPLGLPLSGTRWVPMYAVLRHVGRSSGRRYATPVVAFRTPAGFVIPLPFGNATQWARNLFAAGGGRLAYAGREYELATPRVIDQTDALDSLPRIVRWLVQMLGLRQFVQVRDASVPAGG